MGSMGSLWHTSVTLHINVYSFWGRLYSSIMLLLERSRMSETGAQSQLAESSEKGITGEEGKVGTHPHPSSKSHRAKCDSPNHGLASQPVGR